MWSIYNTLYTLKESNQYDVLASSTSIEKPWTKETAYLVERLR